jgi:hypothetical protein
MFAKFVLLARIVRAVHPNAQLVRSVLLRQPRVLHLAVPVQPDTSAMKSSLIAQVVQLASFNRARANLIVPNVMLAGTLLVKVVPYVYIVTMVKRVAQVQRHANLR